MKPWKWDVAIYDRPHWKSTANNHHQLRPLPDEKLGVQIWSNPADRPATDCWKEQLDDRSLVSEDGGMTWRTAKPDPLPPMRSVRTPSGRTVSVMTAASVRPRQELREHLDNMGLGHLFSDTTFYQYQLYPARMRDELVQQGYVVQESLTQGTDVVVTCAGATLRPAQGGGHPWGHRK